MKIMATSFTRPHADTATLSAPKPAAGHHRPTPPLRLPGRSRASLGQPFVGSLLLSPGFWYAQGSVCALQESISPVLCEFGGSVVGLMVTSCKRAYAIPRGMYPEPMKQPTADPCFLRIHSNTVLSQFLWRLCVLVHTRYVWALWASLAGMGFDTKCDFAPPTILLGLLWPLYMGSFLTVTPAPHSCH